MIWLEQLIARRRQTRRLKDQPLATARLVVVDVETTGLDTERDHLLSIGAVAVRNQRIALHEQFERTLRRPTDGTVGGILIHGITPTQLATGCDPRQALADFLGFCDDSPLVAFHAPFDRRMLQRAIRLYLSHGFDPLFLDLAEIAPALLPDALPPNAGLDHWLSHFGLHASTRHNAAADALATAELLLVVLRHAQRRGIATLGQLLAHSRTARQLEYARLPH